MQQRGMVEVGCTKLLNPQESEHMVAMPGQMQAALAGILASSLHACRCGLPIGHQATPGLPWRCAACSPVLVVTQSSSPGFTDLMGSVALG